MSTTTAKVASPTRVVTRKVRLSYFNGWEPRSIEEGAEKKYGTAILIPKSDTETIDRIAKAVEHLKAEYKAKNGGKLPARFKTPLRDGDEERPDDEAYAGHYFLNATSRNKPGIVDRELQPITDQEKVYSGCYARVSMNFYLFDVSGNRGIAAGLENIQKLADGPALSGGSRPEDDFAEDLDLDDDDLL